MIKVCDAIMGTGKSSAAITYMNEHKGEKFIYITPYLEEAERIKKNCPDMSFVEPSNKLKEFNFRKTEHTAALIKQGKNITTTHQAFKMYSNNMLEDIKKHGYRLIIDEELTPIEKYECCMGDIEVLINAGYIEECDGIYRLIRNDYKGRLFKELFHLMESRDLIVMREESGNNEPNIDGSDDCRDGVGSISLFYWTLPPKLLMSFREVFILTYLFKGQYFYRLLEMYKLPYEYIGIEVDDSGAYRFSKNTNYVPGYASHLGDLIHILDKPKLNAVGERKHALSMGWYKNGGEPVEQLRKNIGNCINNRWRGVPSEQKMCGCYQKYEYKIKTPGCVKTFVPFNVKATNKYKDRRYLIYAVNLFMNVADKAFFQRCGVQVSDDDYALSIMVQWVWRSAIRDGEEIYIYVPSSRMRTLLIEWIKSVQEGAKANDLSRQCCND